MRPCIGRSAHVWTHSRVIRSCRLRRGSSSSSARSCAAAKKASSWDMAEDAGHSVPAGGCWPWSLALLQAPEGLPPQVSTLQQLPAAERSPCRETQVGAVESGLQFSCRQHVSSPSLQVGRISMATSSVARPHPSCAAEPGYWHASVRSGNTKLPRSHQSSNTQVLKCSRQVPQQALPARVLSWLGPQPCQS